MNIQIIGNDKYICHSIEEKEIILEYPEWKPLILYVKGIYSFEDTEFIFNKYIKNKKRYTKEYPVMIPINGIIWLFKILNTLENRYLTLEVYPFE